MPYVPCVPARSTCQRSNVANTCQLVIFTCQHANKSVKCAPIFQTFLLQNAKGNFYTLSLYKKYYIILDIIVIHMCLCIIHANCVILHFYSSQWRDPEILKRVALHFGHHGWPMKEILGFRWSKKDKITLKTLTFCAKYFSEHFEIFSIFVYNESFPMKSYQFFKICKRLG